MKNSIEWHHESTDASLPDVLLKLSKRMHLALLKKQWKLVEELDVARVRLIDKVNDIDFQRSIHQIDTYDEILEIDKEILRLTRAALIEKGRETVLVTEKSRATKEYLKCSDPGFV